MAKPDHSNLKNGAGSRTRTDDRLITNQLLYQLSYAGFTASIVTEKKKSARTSCNKEAEAD